MKVALVHHTFARRGGLERYLFDVTAAFVAAGDAVEVFARHVDGAAATRAGIPVHRLRVPGWPRFWKSRMLARAVERERLQDRFGLSLTCTRTTGQDFYACGGTHAGFVEQTARRPRWFDRNEIAAEAATIAASRLVVAHSAAVQRELEAHYAAAAGKVRLLYPPVDPERFAQATPAARAAARAALGLDDRVALLFAASGDLANKGLPMLLDAFAALPRGRATLLVAGGAAAAVGTRPDVRPLGIRGDMATLYAAADWTVAPSRYEAFGFVIAESLAVGTPVITTQQAGAAELMGASDGIVLSRQDPDELVAALERALREKMRPAPGFIERHRLQPAQHIAALKSLV